MSKKNLNPIFSRSSRFGLYQYLSWRGNPDFHPSIRGVFISDLSLGVGDFLSAEVC